MTLTAEETRSRLRTGAASARKPSELRRPPWHPPALTDFAWDIRVLAFDASLANVGWVAFSIGGGRVLVEGHGTLHPKARDKGYLETWQRYHHLRKLLWEANLALRYMQDRDVLKVVEAPLVGAGHRKESSLVAGMTVWSESEPCDIVSATHVSAVLLGDPRVRSTDRKRLVKAAVLRYVPEAQGRGWDEHQRDGLSVGLTRLFDMREASS